MKKLLIGLYFLSLLFIAQAQQSYYPDANWQTKKPEELKLNKSLIDSAIQLALKSENKVDKDLRIAIMKSYG
ncbi:MAG TPA: hypothetical protein PLF17_14505, partial [Chitinophagaceae bacterium]|nr:hypothetical protein [Chitinophagaceae bacterium]